MFLVNSPPDSMKDPQQLFDTARIHPIREPADTDTDEQDHTVPDGVESKITAMMEIINRNYDTLPADQSYIHAFAFIQRDDESVVNTKNLKNKEVLKCPHPHALAVRDRNDNCV